MAEALEIVLRSVIARGDLAHLVLLLWASGASALLVWALREMAAATRRFDTFVRALARLNAEIREGDDDLS